MVEVAEDNIEVDSFTFEDMSPLGLGERLRSSRCSSNLSLGVCEIFLEGCEGLSRSLAILVKLGLRFHLWSVPG
jgi:hypothetical protein